MIAELLCLAAFVVTFVLRRRGPVAGLISVLAIGYVYGLLRANFRVTASHFIFDAALLGLFTAEIATRVSKLQQVRERHLREWVVALMLMPALLLLLPLQDPLVQLVGFRSAVMFLPFLLLGARLDRSQLTRLGVGLAVLNLLVLGVAVFEFVRGFEMLYPRSAVTELIYSSNDVGGGAHRIPGTFSNSASYGGTVALTIPFLAIAVSAPGLRRTFKAICVAGIVAAMIGVFMSAFRSAAILSACTLLAILVENRRSARVTAAVLVVIICASLIVRTQPRLQRFTTLNNADYVTDRVAGSANLGILQIIISYPFGNGLGAGGTSQPYFLRERVSNPVAVENEYARLVLEQGIVGLAVWVSFLIWVFTKRLSRGHRGIATVSMRTACMIVFGTGILGTGLLSAIPSTILLFMMMGSLVRQTSPIATKAQIPLGEKPPVVTGPSTDVVLAG